MSYNYELTLNTGLHSVNDGKMTDFGAAGENITGEERRCGAGSSLNRRSAFTVYFRYFPKWNLDTPIAALPVCMYLILAVRLL